MAAAFPGLIYGNPFSPLPSADTFWQIGRSGGFLHPERAFFGNGTKKQGMLDTWYRFPRHARHAANTSEFATICQPGRFGKIFLQKVPPKYNYHIPLCNYAMYYIAFFPLPQEFSWGILINEIQVMEAWRAPMLQVGKIWAGVPRGERRE